MIQNKNNSPHYNWGNKCDAWVLADLPDMSFKTELMPPFTSEKLHLHKKSVQLFYILEGTASFFLENEKHILLKNDSLLVKPNASHCISNESALPLEFLVISFPDTTGDRIEIV